MSEVFPESPPSPPPCGCPEQDGRTYHQQGTCTDPVVARLGWYASAPPPATATPGQAAYVASTAVLRSDLKGTPWAWSSLPNLHQRAWDAAAQAAIDAQPPAPAPELAAAMAEARAVRGGYARLCEEFAPGAQSGWSARISLTSLNRHRAAAGLAELPRPARDDRDAWTELGERAEQMEAERDEARGQLAACRAELAEIRRIAYMGGQAPAFVRSELLAYLEANGGQHG